MNAANSTFSGNSDSSGGGGGVRNNIGTMTLRNTIVANSTSGGNCSGAFTDGTGNLQFGGSTANSCGASITTADPKLGALANNGGPTETMALLPGSAAINLGNAATCTASVGSPNFGAGGLDQRGLNRHSGFCDNSAFETNKPLLFLPLIMR